MKVLNLKVLLGLLVMSFALAACSDDDGGGGEGSGSPVIGNWFNGEYEDGVIYVLMADNVAIYYEVPAGSVEELDGTYYSKDMFTYTYEASTKTLTMAFSKYDVEPNKVLQVTDKTMTLESLDEYGGVWSCVRIPDSAIPTVQVDGEREK